MKKTTAIVLAAGSGKRMKSSIRKQYLMIEDKPLLYYSLKAFDDSFIDNIVLVTGKGEEQFCREEIINKYDIRKVISFGGVRAARSKLGMRLCVYP